MFNLRIKLFIVAFLVFLSFLFFCNLVQVIREIIYYCFVISVLYISKKVCPCLCVICNILLRDTCAEISGDVKLLGNSRTLPRAVRRGVS